MRELLFKATNLYNANWLKMSFDYFLKHGAGWY